MRLGKETALPVVLDEFGHVLEADPSVPSVIAAALGPAGQRGARGRTRLILCGSAIAMMRSLTAGEAALRGRAGLELVMQPDDFRQARSRIAAHLDDGTAARLYAIIGGVIGYATDMIDHDLPADLADFDRWVCERVRHRGCDRQQARPQGVQSRPCAQALGAAGFVVRDADPIRSQRPTYALADPFLQFHYAVLEPHGPLLRDRDPRVAWDKRLRATFDARVVGPVFEEQARTWIRRYATESTIGATPDYVGPSSAFVDGTERQLDVVVAMGAEGDDMPGDRTVIAVGEAKSGETLGPAHLNVLEKARASFGQRGRSARLLLFAPAFDARLRKVTAERNDAELVDLERFYRGS